MMQVIYCYLLEKLGFVEELVEWYRSDYVERFKENDTCKLRWDFAFDTERSVEYNRPDIVVILKETKEMIITEGSTPGDMNLTPRTDDKCGKYFELASELKALHDLKSFKRIDNWCNMDCDEFNKEEFSRTSSGKKNICYEI